MRLSDGEQHIAEVMFQLTGVPFDLARRALAKGVRMSCGPETIQPEFTVPTQKGVAEYPFGDHIPTGYDVVHVAYVKYCGACLDPIDKCDPCPHGYFLDDLRQVSLFPAARRDARDDLELCVSVRPSIDACEFPAELLENCEEGIVHAMKGYLMEMPDKPWTNPQLAAYHNQRAMAARTSQAIADARQHALGPVITTGQRWLV